MEVTRPMIAIVTGACLTVGAAGGYLATRHSGSAAPAQGTFTESTGTTSGDEPTAVEQSESVVNEPGTVPGSPSDASSSTSAGAGKQPTARTNSAARPAPAPTTTAKPPATSIPAPSSLPALSEISPIAPAPIEAVRPPEPEAVKAAEPPVPDYLDLVLATDSVIGLQVQTNVSSETARVEDTVVARVTRDVKVGDHVAIPAGAEARGEVTLVERGGKLKDRARLGVRFTSIVFADGSRVPITTETIYRDGDAPGRESTTKIGGGAIGGAIIGGIFGGAKGAAIGSAIGGGAGSAAVMAGGRNAATLPQGTAVTVRLQQPSTVTVPAH
jgi:hypothetical protein